MTIPVSKLKVQIGIVLFAGNLIFAFFSALFFALQWLSELDIILIGSSFIAVGPVAKSFFDAIAFDRTEVSLYSFSDSDLNDFLASLRSEINLHYSGQEEYYVIPKTKFNGYIGYPFDDTKVTKVPVNVVVLREQIQTLISYFSSVHKGAYLSKETLIYYLHKIVVWIRQRQSYEASKQVSDIAKFFMMFSAIAHPAIGIALIWLKALNLFDLSPENLGQASALSSAIFSGYWVSTIKRLNANVVDV